METRRGEVSREEQEACSWGRNSLSGPLGWCKFVSSLFLTPACTAEGSFQWVPKKVNLKLVIGQAHLSLNKQTAITVSYGECPESWAMHCAAEKWFSPLGELSVIGLQ